MDQSHQPELIGSPARQRILKQQQQSQQLARTRIRKQKLKFTFIGYLIVLVFLAIVQFIGIGFFTQGFLLSRQVLPNISECTNDQLNTCHPARFEKAVVLVIDALRFDFAIPVEGSEEYYHNNFPILHKLAQKDNAVLLKFMADPPTTTLQRLKGLTTGSLPTFIDAGSNFDGDAIDEDNWLLQLHRRNQSIAFMGDDTWYALFNEYVNPELNFPYPSLNVWDLDTVDNGVIEHLFPLIQKENRTQWDVLIGHFLGVDHVGHRYGPRHFSMKEKLNQMNQVIEDTIKQIDDKTLLIVMGDHGMDSTGNHGGDSLDELESTLFLYSKNKRFNKKSNDHYNVSELGKNYRSVNQIDLVSTISLLLGLPIPYNNLGFPIDEAFSNDHELNQVIFKAAQQIQSFRDATPNLSPIINEKYRLFMLDYSVNSENKKQWEHLIQSAKDYQYESLEECKRLWARFDLKMISFGIIIIFLSLTFTLTYARSIPSVRVLTMSFEFIGSVIAMSLLGLVLSFSMFVVLKPTDFNLKRCLGLGASLGIIIGFWAPIMDRFSLNWLWHQVRDFFIYNFNSWSFLGLIFVSLHCLIFASNSYVVWEDQMVLFLIITFGFCCIFGSLVNTSLPRTQRILCILHAITFTVLSRVASSITLCREEQRPYCEPTFKSSWWSIVLLHVSSYTLPTIVKSFYELSDSYHSAAPLWIGTGVKFLMFMNAIYWTVEYVQNSEYFLASNFNLSEPLLKSLKLAIARLVLFISLILANFSWSRGPLCVKLDIKEEVSQDSENPSQPQKTATILGYGNVYGSSYFLLVLNFAIAIMLVTKPIGVISLNILIVQILSLLELFDALDIRKNLIAPVVFGLLGYQHFFSTGHQATIPSIQWEIGFMTTESIVFPFTHINIVLNTFGSFFIICLAIPLITLWKIAPSSKPITVLSQIVTNVTTLITYQIFTSLSSLIFAAHFRRHLMVWKIFAPRFMLSGMLLIVFNVFLILITLWFGTGKIVTQVNRIFGK
ncbi:uncharacterized protein CANTADRAFT_21076 [Suhomyces tanzawaensis NRRL Y-17324]|uniref:Uncharacterized protein n=1 Tax=Suhomyces tanzawaensis NRRL Y-17324 TaxID=984487 RepID=A0A1E4SJW7_9ASCO|nr:uncharacterized protein CANTADRAFT_21076 [Suhomyces tanzawaensis NRRL Y-17324]ODV79788.1 hypothetical protein CANTADRAFT_21076 [Suhomyces tanzawaensis NRRL Y-17324]